MYAENFILSESFCPYYKSRNKILSSAPKKNSSFCNILFKIKKTSLRYLDPEGLCLD